VAVTISVGTASYPLNGENPSELVSMADRALYTAKASGRDRIVVSGSNAPVDLPGDHVLVDYLHQMADRVDSWLSSYEHSRAISRWSAVLAAELGLGPAAVRSAELAGRLHDIGKIVIPEGVLRKPGKLSEEEWRLIWQHPDFAFQLVRAIPGYDGVAHIIRQHHERYDGEGYPQRLKGRDIRVEARVLAVCDSWAAMRSERPYRRARSEEQARNDLRAGRGSQFDPDIADTFLDLHQRGLVGELQLVRPDTT
jgi:HD-GYP domain-containing protein (c-di-GMP phosphodiesterase class II)